MKLAIIGAGPLGVECALHFHQLGANVSCFSGPNLKKKSFKLISEHWGNQPCDGNWGEISTDIGRKLTQNHCNLQDIPDLKTYQKTYFKPLYHYLKKTPLHRPLQVDRIQKCLLHPEEKPIKQSRFIDLFRVTYLKNDIEYFEDFDLIIDATGPGQQPYPMGSSHGEALNEKQIRSKESYLYYGYDALVNWSNIYSQKKITIVGPGLLAARILLGLSPYLKNETIKELSLITHEKNLFKKVESCAPFPFFDSINDFIKNEKKFMGKRLSSL